MLWEQRLTDNTIHCVRVFVHGPEGGNPVPLVADARGWTPEQMRGLAERSGYESAFLLPASDARADWRIRYFVPQHEMEMCGHATVGSLWALRQWGQWTTPSAVVETLAGLVDVQWDAEHGRPWVSQPAVSAEPLTSSQRIRVAEVLRLPAAGGYTMTNASTSRVKTLVQMPSVDALQGLKPDFTSMEALCEEIGSTGLYPFALGEMADAGAPEVFARQFPKASGYPEDAATGIAAAALWGHLAATGMLTVGTAQAPITCVVRQGDAMGRPSAIEVRPRFDAAGGSLGCWLSGRVEWASL